MSIKNKLEKNELFQAVLESSRTGVVAISADAHEKYFQDEKGDVPEDENFNPILPEGKEWTSEGFSAVDVSSIWFPNLNNKEGQETLLTNIKTWLKEDFEDSASEDQKKELTKIANNLEIKDFALVKDLITKISRLKSEYKNKADRRDNSWVETKKILLAKENTIFSQELKDILSNLENEKINEWYVWEVCPIKKDWGSWVWVVDTMEAIKMTMASRSTKSRVVSREEYEENLKKIKIDDIRAKLKTDGYEKIGDLWISQYDPTVMVSEIPQDLKHGYSKKKLAEVVSTWLKTVANVDHSAEYVEEY